MEQTPNITPEQLFEALQQPLPETLKSIVEGINDNYEYWNTVKYKQVSISDLPTRCNVCAMKWI